MLELDSHSAWVLDG